MYVDVVIVLTPDFVTIWARIGAQAIALELARLACFFRLHAFAYRSSQFSACGFAHSLLESLLHLRADTLG